MRTKAHARILSVQLFDEHLQRALQIAERHAPIDDKPLALMKNRAVRGIHGVGTVYTPRADDADGRLLRLHRADLHRAGLRAQQHILGEIERILRIARGMAFGHVQHFKVVVIQLHLGARYDVKAHAEKNLLQLPQHLFERVASAARGLPARQRYVDALCLQPRGKRGCL